MIKKIYRLFNCLFINNIKFILIKLFHIKHFEFNFMNLISPFSSIDIQDKGTICFGKMCNILSQNNFGVRQNGLLKIGEGTFINKNCHLVAHQCIEIGNNVCIGPNTIIMDHDHVFNEEGVKKKIFKSDNIIIGDNVWIGANCIILKGSKIGDNSVIGAGSIVRGEIPNNSVYVQKRDTTIKSIK